MHSFDSSARAPYQRYIPSMRSAQETVGGGATSTPIYDALYSEYRRLFRTLPGDRSGEECLHFKGFGTWYGEYQSFGSGGRHRIETGRDGDGPAALPPGSGDNRLR